MNDSLNTDNNLRDYCLVIVLPTFNRSKLLDTLLSQIFTFHHSQFIIHTVVVNDGSTDETSSVLDKFKGISNFHLINGDGNWWWSKSFNEGMKLAFDTLKADYVLSLNDDVEIYDKFFVELYQIIISITEKFGNRFIFNCGSKNIETGEYSDLGVLKDYSNPFKTYKNTFDDFKSDYIVVNHNHGRGLLVTKILYNEIGGFDYNTFPQYLGDSDFALRARKAGFHQFFTLRPYLKSFVDLTAKSAYEKNYSFKNFYKRLTDKYSDSNLKMFYIFNRTHFSGGQFLITMFADFVKINGGYIKRWITDPKHKSSI